MDVIRKGMNFDDWREAWLSKCEEKGHKLKRDRWGGIDTFAISWGHHNGPKCENCGWNTCMHCDFNGDEIPTCTASE